jgi:hypothetical protein
VLRLTLNVASYNKSNDGVLSGEIESNETHLYLVMSCDINSIFLGHYCDIGNRFNTESQCSVGEAC